MAGAGRCRQSWVALAAMAMWLGLGSCDARSQGSDAVPAPPSDPVGAKAYAVLSTHCARCHQAESLQQETSAGGIANILALSEIARDPTLVRRGLPDASPLYTTLLRRAMPPDSRRESGAPAMPNADEIQAVRDWIADLEVHPAVACQVRSGLGPAQIGELIHRALARLPTPIARRTRFLSLTHLQTDCADKTEMAQYRRAATELIQSLSPNAADVRALAVDPEETVLQFDLERIGWSQADWEQLVADYPYAPFYAGAAMATSRTLTASNAPVVRADWLAYGRTAPGGPDQPSGAGAGGRLFGVSLVQALAREYAKPASARRAAAELGLKTDDLFKRLAAAPSHWEAAVQQLRHDVVPRREVLAVQALASGLDPDAMVQAERPGPAVSSANPSLSLSIWPSKTSYHVGDLVTFRAYPNQDCHLTLIGIDKDGQATVLFPNEFEPDNLIKGRQPREIPGPDALYQFRVEHKGRETLIGACLVGGRLPDGIAQDFERQRFTTLGNWRAFLHRTLSEEVVRTAVKPEEPKRGRRRVRVRSAPKSEPRVPPENHARTAVTYDVQ